MRRCLVHPNTARTARVVAHILLTVPAALTGLGDARSAAAQQGAPPPVWCVPGTVVCVQGAGQGNGNGAAGATLGGSASGQIGPNGAQGRAQAQGNADVNANANANAAGQASRQQRQPEETVSPQHHRARVGPPLAIGTSPCLVGRVGIWSGYHGGVCFGFGLRAHSGVGFELESVALAGGTVPTLDLLLRPTLVVPLAGTTPYFDQLSLKIGSTVVGGSIPLEGSKSYLRFGGSVGLGYDFSWSDSVNWRVLDASFYGEVRVGPRRPAYMDRLGDSWDLGLMVSTGLLFH